MKKTIFTVCLAIAIACTTNAQVGIGIPTTQIHPSAQLDVSSTTKGFLPPRMTCMQGHSIANPSAGLMFWCTDCGAQGELQVFNGIFWTNMMGGVAAEAVSNDPSNMVFPEGDVQIGDSFRGGIIAYILQPCDPGYDPDPMNAHGLIMYPTTLSATWGCWLSAPTAPNGTAVGTGNQNTIDIVGPAGCQEANTAARICADLSDSGYDDWYLPSRDEMYRIWTKRAQNGLGEIDGFSPYWTSSIQGGYTAYSISVLGLIDWANPGFYSTSFRYEERPFRPVRSF
jgi:hypothetical protein